MNKTLTNPPANEPRFERDPAFLDTYANHLRLNIQMSDFTLFFGVTDNLGPNDVVNRDKVAVHLPPTVAKILLVELQAVIDAYEKAVAPIPVPFDLEAHIQAIRPQLEAGLGHKFPPKKAAK